MSSFSTGELAGLTAMVTGSTSGIGRATALELARHGAHCLVHGRNQDQAEAVVAELRAGGGQGQIILGDLADPATRAEIVRQAWAWRGAVDVWVNNAGADVLTGEPAGWTFDHKLDLLYRVDLAATIALSRAVGALMKERGRGTIINIGWDQAQTGMAGDSGQMFAAIKGAIASFSASLARSLAPQVRVNCVAPGWIKTKWGEGASQAWQERARDESLLGRWGTPEDVAAVVRFLASPAAAFVSAQVVAVNGGLKSS